MKLLLAINVVGTNDKSGPSGFGKTESRFKFLSRAMPRLAYDVAIFARVTGHTPQIFNFTRKLWPAHVLRGTPLKFCRENLCEETPIHENFLLYGNGAKQIEFYCDTAFFVIFMCIDAVNLVSASNS